MAEITISSVSKVYPEARGKAGGAAARAVDNVSLVCPSGSFTVLVGPSGCGKSTTLRMIAGLEEISEGTISIGGRVVNGVAPKDRDIAMVFQNYALYPHMTVYKNMAFALKMRKIARDEIDRRVRAVAETLSISELLDRRPGQLSGGQRQRVAVGRAIVREPKAFLFDEPLSNLDAKLRVSTRAELKALHARLKTTTVYVTHDQEEAMTLGDTVVVMSKGKIQQAAAPLEVYRRPANRFVAAFVGTPPMNFLDGSLLSEGGGIAFQSTPAAGTGAPPIRVKLSGELAAALAQYGNKPVVLGIRPQAMEPSSGDADSRPILAAPVEVVEPLGDQMDISLAIPGHPRLVARIPATDSITPGRVVKFALIPERLHVFEPGEFGRNLTRS